MISAPLPSARRAPSSQPLFTPGYLSAFVLVTSLFFLWGVPNNLNDILIRQFMKSFAITRLEAGLVQSAFYMGYFLLAFPSALLMRRFGYKAGFLAGLGLFGSGTLLFWPAALVGRYGFFLVALFIMASGLAFLETAAGTFIALAGPSETSERRLNISQAFNPLGAISGALIGTVFIFSGIQLSGAAVHAMQVAGTYDAYLHSETLRVVRPYVILGIIALVLAFLLWRAKFPVLNDELAAEARPTSVFHVLRNRHLLLSVVAQFFYVGAQVGTWSYYIQYVLDYTGLNEKTAGYFLTGTLVMFGVGRFFSSWLMKYIAPARLMGIYSLALIALVAAAVLHPGWTGAWLLFATSFFMAPMYPTIFALGLQGLGADSKVGGSLIVMAIVGGAVLTPIMGVIADHTHHTAIAYLVPLASYCLIMLYAFFAQPVHRLVSLEDTPIMPAV